MSSGGAILAQEDDLPEAPDTIRVDVNLVSLRFTVRNAAGEFVLSLSPDDVRVYENGRIQELAFFETPRSRGQPSPETWIAFLIDVSGSTFATRGEEILAARSFFANLYDFTKIGVFGFTDQLLSFQEFTSDRQLALAAFSSAQQHLGKTALYESVGTLISRMKQRIPAGARKSIIIVSDGMDDAYRRSAQIVSRARIEDVVIYTVWIPSATQLYISPTSDPVQMEKLAADRRRKEAAFRRLSSATGGRHFGGFEAILDFDEVLAEINDEIFGNLYSVGYYTEDPFSDRRERNIQVVLKRPDLSVHGIYKNVPDLVRAKKRLISALFENSALGDLPQEIMAIHEIGSDLDVSRPRFDGEMASIPVRIKISPYRLRTNEKGDVQTQFGVIGQLADYSGNEVLRLREVFRANLTREDIREGRGIFYTNRLVAPPGNYMLRFALLEIASWRMSFMERPIRIEAP
jgi:VWFA-related protein